MIQYYVTVRIGFYDFTREFTDQQSAIECFDSIATNTDLVIEDGFGSSPSTATVNEVALKVVEFDSQIGNPNRR